MDRKLSFWIAAVIVALAVGRELASGQGENDQVGQKWEYQSVAGSEYATEALKQYGNSGWELVTVIKKPDGGPGTMLYFKRPK